MVRYGYCRVSMPQQNIERQVRNISKAFPDAIIVRDVHTRSSMEGRQGWARIMRVIKPGDAIIFDSVSRLSGNAEEGISIYMSLYEKNVDLVFLNEPHINTAVYRSALENQIPMTGTDVDAILAGVNEFLMRLASNQIRIAFEQSEKEVLDLRLRTKGGIETARLNGKQIGRPGGRTYETKKAKESKKLMLDLAKDFGGNLSNQQCIKLLQLHPNTYYKYKRELHEDIAAGKISLK